MKYWCLTFCFVVASLFGSVEVGFALPECPHDDSRNWHMCSQKRVGQRGVEGKDYSYLFVDWRRGEIKGKLKYRYFNGYKCTTLWTTQKQVGLAIYKILGGKVEKIKHCPQSWPWMQLYPSSRQIWHQLPT